MKPTARKKAPPSPKRKPPRRKPRARTLSDKQFLAELRKPVIATDEG